MPPFPLKQPLGSVLLMTNRARTSEDALLTVAGVRATWTKGHRHGRRGGEAAQGPAAPVLRAARQAPVRGSKAAGWSPFSAIA